MDFVINHVHMHDLCHDVDVRNSIAIPFSHCVTYLIVIHACVSGITGDATKNGILAF